MAIAGFPVMFQSLQPLDVHKLAAERQASPDSVHKATGVAGILQGRHDLQAAWTPISDSIPRSLAFKMHVTMTPDQQHVYLLLCMSL